MRTLSYLLNNNNCNLLFQIRKIGTEQNVINNGGVAEFRKRLWSEHTSGQSDEDHRLKDPGSIECFQRVYQLSKQSFFNYTDQGYKGGLDCRFMRYFFKITLRFTLLY